MSRAREIAELGAVYDSGALSNRNLIINGAMQVWQRGTSNDTASSGDYSCDRWKLSFNGLDGNVDWDQETSSTPEGFGYALKVSTDASESSLDTLDYLILNTRLEGQNLQQLQKGTSGSKQLSVSFWVKSSVASTYTFEIEDADNSRIIGRSYTVDAADTWEYKTLVIDGDTAGALDNDENSSFVVSFWIDGGTTFTSGTFSTSWASSNNPDRLYDTTGWLESSSPEFYITGVQLEVGPEATPFEHRSYGDELARCQRYFEIREWNGDNTRIGMGYCDSTTSMVVTIPYFVTKRVDEPTFSATGTSNIRSNTTGTNRNITSGSISMSGGANKDAAVVSLTGLSGSVGDGQGGQVAFVGAGSLQFDAEL